MASQSDDLAVSISQAPNNGKRRKSLILASIVIVMIVLLAVIGFVLLQEEHFRFTSFQGTSITTVHSDSGDTTTTFHWQWTNTEMYKVGEPMDFWFRSYNSGGGTLILVGAESNLTGFTYKGSSPAFPIVAPNTTDSDQGLRVTLIFDTPSTGYEGPFRFNIYYDWYPSPPNPPGTENNITEVIEKQIIGVHTSEGTTTQIRTISHPDLVGMYETGAPMSFTELYQYSGMGRMNLSSIVADTSGFSFLSSTPSLPIVLPNVSQPWLSLAMEFEAPTYQYNGSFNYTVYLDEYLEAEVPMYHELTSVLEVQYVTTHFGSASNTLRYLRWHNETAGLYPVGKPVNITEPFWNIAGGALTIVNIVANTTGFALIGTNPSLPVLVPNSPDADSGNVTVLISFQAPAPPYTGDFVYTVYFEGYPLSW